MKKLFLISLAITGILAWLNAASNQVVVPYSVTFEPTSTPASSALAVSSSTVTTIAAVDFGAERTFVNNSTTTVYMLKGSTVSVTTNGLPLPYQTPYICDKWFGTISFQAPAGTSGNCDVRNETVKTY